MRTWLINGADYRAPAGTLLPRRRLDPTATAAPEATLLPQPAVLGNVAGPIAVRARAVVDGRDRMAPRLDEFELADMSVHDCETSLSEQEPQRQCQICDLALL